jgi:hypothetical protein
MHQMQCKWHRGNPESKMSSSQRRSKEKKEQEKKEQEAKAKAEA